MAAIKGKDTGPERYLRKQLFAKGYRYRLNVASIVGHPDMWLRKYHTAIFVNGCFWHRHAGCRFAYTPKSRTEFWNSKFEKNTQRDKDVRVRLEQQGIKCLVVWECTIKKMMKNGDTQKGYIYRIEEFLTSESLYAEI